MLLCALGLLSLLGFSCVQIKCCLLLVSVRPRMMSVTSLDDVSWLKFVVWVVALDPEEWLNKETPWYVAAALLSFNLTWREPNHWALLGKI